MNHLKNSPVFDTGLLEEYLFLNKKIFSILGMVFGNECASFHNKWLIYVGTASFSLTFFSVSIHMHYSIDNIHQFIRQKRFSSTSIESTECRA
jgi:hypothetical protein